MWWQIVLVFWIAFQLGFFVACLLAASRRPAGTPVELREPAWLRNARIEALDRF